MTAQTTQSELQFLDLEERPWAAYASCRKQDPDLFFPNAEEASEEALRICRGCPVLADCRDWALMTKVRYGIWGAMTERDRRRVLRRSA